MRPQPEVAGTHRYGRRSYELFRAVSTGPAAPPPAGMMTSTPKIMVSTSLDNPDWDSTTVISTDVTAELTKLKQEAGQDISVGASGTLIRFLLQQGLLDELRLLVHPVVVGADKHLFEEGTGQVPLALIEARSPRNGVVALRYAPAAPTPAFT